MVFDDFYQIVGLFLLLATVYDMLCCFRACWVSGFRFYLGPIVLLDLPMGLTAVVIVAARPSIETFGPILFMIPIILSSITHSWVVKQQEKAQRTCLAQWQVWEDKIGQAGRVDKVLFYRVIRRPSQSTSRDDAASIRSFRILMSILAVIALMGIVLFGVILLSYRG